MRKSATSLICGLVLLALSMTASAQGSLAPRIPVVIAAGDYAEAEMLISEAFKIGVITSAAAEAYRRDIRQAKERSAARGKSKKQQADQNPLPILLTNQLKTQKKRPGKTGAVSM